MTSRRFALALWAAGMMLTAIAVVLLAVTFDAPVPDSWGFRGFTTTFAVLFGTLGLIIVLARAHPIGWMLLSAGSASGLQDFAEEYAIYGAVAHPGSLPLTEYFAWFESWSWVVTVALVAIYLPLVFPNGRLASPRWKWVAIAGAVTSAGMVVGLMLNEGPLNNAAFVRNPFGVPGLRLIDVTGIADATNTANAPFFLFYVSMFLCAVLAVVSLFGRFRRAVGIERQQLKWFALGAAFASIGMIIGGVFQTYKAAQVLFIVAIEVIPFAVALAILRYRLYDIDVVINRALVYGVTVTIVGAGFVSAVLLLQTLLRPLTAGSDLAIAASTLATVAAFQPLRRRVQGAIDRRFYRARYDASRTLDRFATQLRDEVDLDALRSELIDVVGETVRPTHAGVWLREVRP